MSAPPYVAVCGSGTAGPEEEAAAEAIGRGLAAEGAVLVCGGLGGAMAAACRGARAAGGTTVGLLPGSDRAGANEWLSVAIPTGLGELRNGLVVRAADAVIALGRATGTLSEIALALRIGRPVVGLETWDLGVPELVVADGPDQAVALALAGAGGAAPAG